jgi:hypothetical protein
MPRVVEKTSQKSAAKRIADRAALIQEGTAELLALSMDRRLGEATNAPLMRLSFLLQTARAAACFGISQS